MISFALLRDSSVAESAALHEFNTSLRLVDTSLSGGISFLEEMLEFLQRAPPGILSEPIVLERVLTEMEKMKHRAFLDSVKQFKLLHPSDRQKNWRFFLAILKTHEQQELQVIVAQADLKVKAIPASPAALDGGGRQRN